MSLARVTGEERKEIVSKAVELIEAGETIKAAAQKLGVHPSTLHGWILSEEAERWPEIRDRGIVQRIIDADDELENAKDPVAVSKAREKCKNVRWDAQRLLKRFSDKQDITATVTHKEIPLSEAARRLAFIMASGNPIDAEMILPDNSAPSHQ